MVTSRGKRIGQSNKYCFAVMFYGRYFAVHDARGTYYVSSESVTDGLMPQTYSHYRNVFMKFADDINSYSRLQRSAGTRRKKNSPWFKMSYFFNLYFVITIYFDF